MIAPVLADLAFYTLAGLQTICPTAVAIDMLTEAVREAAA